jgi:hypothetical protein
MKYYPDIFIPMENKIIGVKANGGGTVTSWINIRED